MSERMDRKREERRNRILDVAEAMMASKGIGGMTMEDVAREADVAAGTTYLHFKNKNALCAAVLARLFKQVAIAEAEQASSSNTGSEKLLAYRKALAGFLLRNPEKRQILHQLRLIDLTDTRDENVLELITQFNYSVQLVAQFYRDGIEEGIIRPDVDPVPTAIFMCQALVTSADLPPLVKAMLRLNDIAPERWAEVTGGLLTMATHTIRSVDEITGQTGPAQNKRKSS